MTYRELDNLLGLTNLKDFTNHLTVKGCQVSVAIRPDGTFLLLDEDKWKYWGLNFDWANPWGITDKINTLVRNIQDIWRKVLDIFHFVWEAFGTGWKSWWNEIWEAIRRMYYNFTSAFFEFTRDPWGYLWRVITAVVSPLISGIKTVLSVTWRFAYDLWNYLSNWISPLFDSVKNTILNWITARIDSVYTWINNLRTSISNWFKDQLREIGLLSEKMSLVWKNITETIPSELAAIKSSIEKTFDFGLGGLADAFYNAISNIFGTFWDWFKEIIGKGWSFVNKSFLMPLKAGSEEVMSWFWEQIQEMIRTITDVAKRMLPRAPEQGSSMVWEALGFLGMGAGVLALMTLGGGMAKRISGADIPGLGAIVADFSGFKYITGAIMGGLVLAAYTIPLKYYYNALFKPWLPSWMETQMAFGRSKISPELFKFFQKYAGIEEKYFDMYQVLAYRPISAFMIRYIADAEITDPIGIFRICMDNGYSPEHAGFMAFAMTWGANGIYRSKVFAGLQRCYKEGYISKPRLDLEVANLKSTELIDATYYGVYGHSTTVQIKVGLDQTALITLAAEWDSFFDSMGDKVATVKTLYNKETITLSEFKAGLVELGITPLRIDDIVAREKAKKRGKTEPDKGKILRDVLKGVIRKCFKEGFITKEMFESWLASSNVVVDEPSLLKAQAWWEAYYDDMMDWRKIYEKLLTDGTVTESEFKLDLIDMGFKPEKVELMIKYDQAKKGVRAKK